MSYHLDCPLHRLMVLANVPGTGSNSTVSFSAFTEVYSLSTLSLHLFQLSTKPNTLDYTT